MVAGTAMVTYIRGHIMVKKEFVEMILKGVKTATIRLGKVVPRSREIIIHGGGRPIAKALIEKVEYKRVKELTAEDASNDGYGSVEELIKALGELYKTRIREDDIVTVIRFRVVKKFTDIDLNNTYLGFEPIDIAKLASRYLTEELSEEEKEIVNVILRYKSIRLATIKLFGSLNKRRIVRRVLKVLLARLIEKGVIEVDREKLRKLAELSSFWKKLYFKIVHEKAEGLSNNQHNSYS
jgi:hypothetical protein